MKMADIGDKAALELHLQSMDWCMWVCLLHNDMYFCGNCMFTWHRTVPLRKLRSRLDSFLIVFFQLKYTWLKWKLLSRVRLFMTHGLGHARLPCPSPSLGAYSNSCPSSRWCHPTISSSVVPFSSCPQSFPASGSFPVSQFFASGDQRIGASASASVLPLNILGWFPLGWTGLIFLQSEELSRVFSTSTKGVIWLHSFFFN